MCTNRLHSLVGGAKAGAGTGGSTNALTARTAGTFEVEGGRAGVGTNGMLVSEGGGV